MEQKPIKMFLLLVTSGLFIYILFQIEESKIIVNNIAEIAQSVQLPMLMSKSNVTPVSDDYVDKEINIHANFDESTSFITYQDDMPLNTSFPTEYFKLKPYNHSGPNLKKILFWNDAYGGKHWGFGYGQEPFIKAGCKIDTCFITSNREEFDLLDVDAVIWHFRSSDKTLPSKRSNHTRYVFWMMESAVHLFGNLKPFNGKFNWTMTYRLDSDIPRPYGFVQRLRSKNTKFNLENINTANKTKVAAWFVSNCVTSSKRETLVKALSKHIQVDIYGKCGKFTCSRKIHGDCLKMLERDYKFYLAFENSLCLDYASEKFFNTLQYNVIPVVYGLGQYDKVAPPHSYINALDFNSPKELADYLIYLDNNPDKYNEYLLWKQYYVNIGGWAIRARSFCTLCEKLHDVTAPNHVYTDLYEWFVTKSKCSTGKNKLTKSR